MSSFELGTREVRPIATVGMRERAVVHGTISATRTETFGSGPVYVCTLADGTAELDLLFLGRRAVPALVVGTRLRAEGTCLGGEDRPVFWNPLYQLEDVVPETQPTPETQPSPEAQPSPEPPVAPAAPAQQATAQPEPADSGVLVEAAGHFRIYLGAASGVGKTVAMLDEAQRRHRRGTDIVIGFVETHGRPVTVAHTEDLEVVPRKKVTYRGAVLEEMDLDAVLARAPRVALIDELAHTNVPGSGRHEKRWEDVLELLEAGIDVITTVNIQHLESIADAVEQITGVSVRERVPDWVVRRADQTELVDSSPEALRRRMLHGNIYPREKVPQALTNFFRTDNLTALRELALRFVADETEEALLELLARHQDGVVWETTERIMVAVTTAPGTDAIVRRAGRMAARVKADLHVIHVSVADTGRERNHDQLDRLHQLATDLGATWHEVTADDPVKALIEYATGHQITQMVIGSSGRTRWQELMGGGSVVKRISRQATNAGLDVHIIARRDDQG